MNLVSSIFPSIVSANVVCAQQIQYIRVRVYANIFGGPTERDHSHKHIGSEKYVQYTEMTAADECT